MATYLDVLVELLTDPDGRAAYREDPAGWLHASGVGFLCGEDIVAAGAVISDWVPDLAGAFAGLEGTDPQPAIGESELEAAIRVLGLLVERAPVDRLPDAASFG